MKRGYRKKRATIRFSKRYKRNVGHKLHSEFRQAAFAQEASQVWASGSDASTAGGSTTDPPNWRFYNSVYTMVEDTVAPTCIGLMPQATIDQLKVSWKEIKPIKMVFNYSYSKFEGNAGTNTYDNDVFVWWLDRTAIASPNDTAETRLQTKSSAQTYGASARRVFHHKTWSTTVTFGAMKLETDWGGSENQTRWQWRSVPWMTMDDAAATADIRRLRLYNSGAWALQDLPKGDDIRITSTLFYKVRGSKVT